MVEWSSSYGSNVAGEIALVVSLVMWGTSIDRVRRNMFELFFYSHHLYILYIFFYMLHVGLGCLCMILPGIFLFLIDRYLRLLQSRRRTRLLSSRLLPNGTMELTFAKDPGDDPRNGMFGDEDLRFFQHEKRVFSLQGCRTTLLVSCSCTFQAYADCSGTHLP